MVFKTQGKHLLLLLGILLLQTTCWFAMKPVAPKTDDLVYFSFASEVLQGDFHLTDSPKNHRIALIYPVAFLLRIFGTNPFAISFFPLLCSLITICIVFLSLRRNSGIFAACIAATLIAINTIQLTFTSALFPDVVVSMYMIFCALLLYEVRLGKISSVPAAFLFLFALIAGFLTKEIILLSLPFVLIIFFKDLIDKKNQRFWKYLAGGGILSALLLAYYYQHETGDWKFIYHSVDQNHNEVFVPYTGSMALFARYTYEPLTWLFGSAGFIFLLVFSIPEIVVSLRNKTANRFSNFITWYFLFLLCAFWLGTTSFSRMAPVPLYERMWLPLLAPLCILSASTIHRFCRGELKRWHEQLLIFLPVAGCIIANIFLSRERGMLFLSFALTVMIAKIARHKWKSGYSMSLAISIAPFVVLCIYFLFKNSNWIN